MPDVKRTVRLVTEQHVVYVAFPHTLPSEPRKSDASLHAFLYTLSEYIAHARVGPLLRASVSTGLDG
jgi:hypothetical protein